MYVIIIKFAALKIQVRSEHVKLYVLYVHYFDYDLSNSFVTQMIS